MLPTRTIDLSGVTWRWIPRSRPIFAALADELATRID
jgi:hypothetical protein